MDPERALSLPRYPAILREQIAHVGRFVRTLRMLHEAAGTSEAAFLWLEGRAEEVAVFSLDVLEAWAKGAIDTDAAARAIDDYLHALHGTLEGWYGEWYAPSCCGPLAAPPPSGTRRRSESRVRRVDTMTDTVVDAPAAPMPPRADSPPPEEHALPFMYAMA